MEDQDLEVRRINELVQTNKGKDKSRDHQNVAERSGAIQAHKADHIHRQNRAAAHHPALVDHQEEVKTVVRIVNQENNIEMIIRIVQKADKDNEKDNLEEDHNKIMAAGKSFHHQNLTLFHP